MAVDKPASPFKSIYLRISILIIVALYFAFGSYWLYVTSKYSPYIISEFPHYSEMLKETWWIITYYSSELFLSAGIVLRWAAGILALYSALIFLLEGENALPKIRGKVGAAIFLEGLYVMTYAPSAFLGFVYPVAESRGLWYFEPAPPTIIVLFVNGLACTAMVVLIVPSILKLGLRIFHSDSSKEIIKWGCITGVLYLFAMFWWNYTMAWAATLVYWPERAQPGIQILCSPIAAAGFSATTIGLMLIAILALKVTMPAIRGHFEEVNLRKLGYVMLAFGCYFILMLGLYVAAGGYYSQPTTWMEIIGPHNPDLWCISLILLGIHLILKPIKS